MASPRDRTARSSSRAVDRKYRPNTGSVSDAKSKPGDLYTEGSGCRPARISPEPDRWADPAWGMQAIFQARPADLDLGDP